MRPGEIAFMQRHAANEMERHGYAIEPIELSGTARARYLFTDTPVNLARMMGWSLRERVLDAVGRAPGAHTMSAASSP
jgi:hypothetical protein